MSWASSYIAELQAGRVVSFRPRGDSMSPKIRSGQLVTLEPITPEMRLRKDDVVLCRVHASDYLHFVYAVDRAGRCQIGNARGHINGWASAVYGRLVRIED